LSWQNETDICEQSKIILKHWSEPQKGRIL
jgi:hypothetical protein